MKKTETENKIRKQLLLLDFIGQYFCFLYGAVCWGIMGFNGLLIGSCFIIIGTIIGFLLIKLKNKQK